MYVTFLLSPGIKGLRNKLLKYPAIAYRISYSFSLLRKKRKKHFANLNVKNVTDNKFLTHYIKPFFTRELKFREKNAVMENKKPVSDNTEVANYLNNLPHILLKILKFIMK